MLPQLALQSWKARDGRIWGLPKPGAFLFENETFQDELGEVLLEGVVAEGYPALDLAERVGFAAF